MKQTWILALAYGIPTAITMIVFKAFEYGAVNMKFILLSVIIIIFSVLAGLAFAFFMKYLASKLGKSITIDLDSNEKAVKEGGANQLIKFEGVGGKMVLTDRRLIFKSHKVNVQNHQEVFDLSQIKSLKESKTFNLLKNRLTVETSNGASHTFIVDSPGEWIQAIQEKKSGIQF